MNCDQAAKHVVDRIPRRNATSTTITHREITSANAVKPIEVPRCLDRKRYIENFIQSQPD